MLTNFPRQFHRFLAAFANPDADIGFVCFDQPQATTFGYLIGERLDLSRDALLQNADTLNAKVKADRLPGYDDRN